MTIKMEKSLLKTVTGMNGGRGTVKYRRMLGPEVFRTNWGYVDHVLIPSDSSIGYHRHEVHEEICYVLSGKGRVTIEGSTLEIAPGDAIACRVGEAHGFYNHSPSDLELMVIGVALEKGKFEVMNLNEDLSKR